ncbi:hypothetical protein VVF07_30210, partial [Pseudomonas aeruginosa]|uniref:hypothetical protein n=1 Tax=Pseudomonas aeruginosa TaxID=287 RepID=UPI00300A2BAC
TDGHIYAPIKWFENNHLPERFGQIEVETGLPPAGRPYESAKLGCVRANSSEAEKIYFRRFL